MSAVADASAEMTEVERERPQSNWNSAFEGRCAATAVALVYTGSLALPPREGPHFWACREHASSCGVEWYAACLTCMDLVICSVARSSASSCTSGRVAPAIRTFAVAQQTQ